MKEAHHQRFQQKNIRGHEERLRKALLQEHLAPHQENGQASTSAQQTLETSVPVDSEESLEKGAPQLRQYDEAGHLDPIGPSLCYLLNYPAHPRLLPPKKLKRRVLTFAKTKTGDSYHQDKDGNYWNLMYFIDKSVTHEIVTSEEIAYEGGRLLGQFLTLTSDFDASKLVEVIPKFHDMSFRYRQFEDAVKIASLERLERAKNYIKLVADLKEEMHIIQNLKESGEIKLRVTHNDTKISNALFNKKNKGLCLIDTDTVMPGVVHYDFGDAIRTICNTAAEDETNLELVEFNLDYYKAYKKGFLKKMKSSLSPVELRYLPLSAKTMIFIMALRFLTDYLNNDIYYKTKYPEHNLDRSKNQFKLIQSFSERIKQLKN